MRRVGIALAAVAFTLAGVAATTTAASAAPAQGCDILITASAVRIHTQTNTSSPTVALANPPDCVDDIGDQKEYTGQAVNCGNGVDDGWFYVSDYAVNATGYVSGCYSAWE